MILLTFIYVIFIFCLELAQTYRIEGNFNFKNKLYQKALINYKEGLKQNCSDELKATLYNNCAAVNFELQNFR